MKDLPTRLKEEAKRTGIGSFGVDRQALLYEAAEVIAGLEAQLAEIRKDIHHEKVDNGEYLARAWREKDEAIARAARYEEALKSARDELGVPPPWYPAPIANAADIIAVALTHDKLPQCSRCGVRTTWAFAVRDELLCQPCKEKS